MPGKRSVLAANPQQRPHDLDKKYRKLAIPAVAAAVAVNGRRKQNAPEGKITQRSRDRDS